MKSWLFFLPIGLYAAVIILQFIRSLKTSFQDVSNYLIAGRNLSLPAFVASLVTGWYGGILGVGEYSFHYGISVWLVFGVPYYLAALLFSFFLSGKIRQSRVLTIPEQLEIQYNRKVSILGATIIFIQCVPASYILELGILIRFFTDWPLRWCIIIGTILSTVYIFTGGLKMMVRTHLIQFVLMFLGFIVILSSCWAHFGGMEFLKKSVDPGMFTWHGGNKPVVILIWYFLAMSTLAEPLFYQRSAAARSPAIARWGIVVSVGFWIIFDFLTTFTGIYARAILKTIPDPTMAYPLLSQMVLPPLLHGFFICSMLAIIMSTIDSFAFISAITAGRDILLKLMPAEKKKYWPEKTMIQLGLIITAIFSILIACLTESVVQLWYAVGSIGIPAILVPVVSSYSRYRISAGSAMIIMIGSSCLSLFWLSTPSLFQQESYLWSIEPVFPGLGLAVVTWGINLFRQLRSA